MRLTAYQRRAYTRDGYLHLRQMFSQDEVQAIRDALDGLGHYNEPWAGDWRDGRTDTESTDMLMVRHELSDVPGFRSVVAHPALVRAVGRLIDAAPVLHHSISIVKPPTTGQPFPLHQDSEYFLHTDERFVVVTVYLDDVTRDNGSIRFVPGSHVLGLLPHVGTVKRYLETPSITDTVLPMAKSGDVVLANYHTVHGSYPNRSAHVRRAIRLGYRHPHNYPLNVVTT